MKTKKLLISLIVTAFAITLGFSPAVAGSKQRHRWEGVAIGVGAAILGNAIFQARRADQPPEVVYVVPEPAYPDNGPNRRHGHWEWQQTWVPPLYERVWNPGHYNPNGSWVNGHWMDLETYAGHWTQERVWVADNRRHQ